MSSWEDPAVTGQPALRRVRDEVKDGLAVVCFSLAASTALAIVLTLVTKLAG